MRDLARIDWNLIPALDALLTERNVSRAAQRLGTSQPSTSSALARLRRHFDDELLVRQGNRYTLTPLAERLAPLTREAVDVTTNALASSGTFDPGSSSREFTLAASDYVQVVVAPVVAAELRRRAPNVRLSLPSPFAEPFRDDAEILSRTDGWLAPPEVMPGKNSTGLLADRWVCVVSEDHPTVRDRLTTADLRRLSWVAPAIRGEHLRLLVEGLTAQGVDLHIAVTTASFSTVPFLVAGTEHIGLMQGRLADRLSRAAGVRVVECPWAVQSLHLTFWWDVKWETDPAHTWFRNVLASCMTHMQT